MRKNVLAVVSINLLQPGPALSFFFFFFFPQWSSQLNGFFDTSHYNEKNLVYFLLSTFFYNNCYRTKREINKKISCKVYFVSQEGLTLRIKPTGVSKFSKFQIYKSRLLHEKLHISIGQSSSADFCSKIIFLYKHGKLESTRSSFLRHANVIFLIRICQAE